MVTLFSFDCIIKIIWQVVLRLELTALYGNHQMYHPKNRQENAVLRWQLQLHCHNILQSSNLGKLLV